MIENFRQITAQQVRAKLYSLTHGMGPHSGYSREAQSTHREYWGDITDRVHKMPCENLAEMCTEAGVHGAASARQRTNCILGGVLIGGATLFAPLAGGLVTLLGAAGTVACLAAAAYHSRQNRQWRHTELELTRIGIGLECSQSSGQTGASSRPQQQAATVRPTADRSQPPASVTVLQTPPRGASRLRDGETPQVIYLDPQDDR